MNVSVGERWETFVEATLKEGRYGSASEVVREGLRLVEEREAKLRDLKRTIEASLAGGYVTETEIGVALTSRGEELRSAGVAE